MTSGNARAHVQGAARAASKRSSRVRGASRWGRTPTATARPVRTRHRLGRPPPATRRPLQAPHTRRGGARAPSLSSARHGTQATPGARPCGAHCPTLQGRRSARVPTARVPWARARDRRVFAGVFAPSDHTSRHSGRARGLAPPGPGRAGRCLLSREQLEVGATFDHRPQCPALCLAGHRLCRAEDEPVENPLRCTPPKSAYVRDTAPKLT